MNKIQYYDIDIVGTCNLRCPTCPVGNFRDSDYSGISKRPRGFMDFQLFREIVEKIISESEQRFIYLYNWGEPLLHPQLDDFVSHLKRLNIPCGLSSNLNVKKESIDKAVVGGPDEIRISTSGLSNETYEITHLRGKVERLKDNMEYLRKSINHHKVTTKCHVLYHVYKNNAAGDLMEMAKLCNKLGFELIPVWAMMMPMEKYLQIERNQLSDKDKEIVQRLAVPPTSHLELAQKNKTKDCFLQNDKQTINFDGSVALCCSVYDPKYTIAKSFLDMSNDALQKIKVEHDLCSICMDAGISNVVTYKNQSALDKIGNKHIAENGSPYKLKNNIQVKLSGDTLRLDPMALLKNRMPIPRFPYRRYISHIIKSLWT